MASKHGIRGLDTSIRQELEANKEDDRIHVCTIMPTSMDVPSIRVYFEEMPYPYGPAGAKGIGELPMDGPAPAIVNAVANATGADVTRIPLTPEQLMPLIEEIHGV